MTPTIQTSRPAFAVPSRRAGTSPAGASLSSTSVGPHASVSYQPILDVAKGTTAGYQTQPQFAVPRELDVRAPSVLDEDTDGALTAAAAATALSAIPTLPRNTFVTIPVPCGVVGSRHLRDVLLERESLAGVVLDIVGYSTSAAGQTELALAAYRSAGALVAVGGYGAPQPELTSIVRLKPAIVRLGRDWVRGVDHSESKRSAIELIGHLAGQLDAWILAEGVSTAAELRALSGLAVPLAQGPFVGEPQRVWPEIELSARTALPQVRQTSDGTLRALLQQAYTARDAAAAAAVLPETTGFDILVVIDDHRRPTSLLEQDAAGCWGASDALTINIDTPMPDAVARAMARPRLTRFTPLVCTDNAGRFLGILRIDRLMSHLAGEASGVGAL